MRFPPEALYRGLGLIQVKLAEAFLDVDPISGMPLPQPPPMPPEVAAALAPSALTPAAQSRRSSARVRPPKIVTTR